MTYDFIWPWPKGKVSSQEFGTRPGGVNPAGGHTGIDVPLPVGTALRAPADGVVEAARWFYTSDGSDNPWLLTVGGGICLVINHGKGLPTTIMCHLNETKLNPGDKVKKGQVVAWSGNTGKWTTGPHCHFEVFLDKYNIKSSTYGRSNPRLVCTLYWEDVLAVQPQGDISTPIMGFQRDSIVEIRQRSAPDHNSTLIKSWAADTRFDFGAFTTKGTDPYGDGNRLWFKGRYSDTWFHSSGFGDKGTHDLQDFTPADPTPAPPPVVVTPPTPTAPKYDFVQDIFKVGDITVEKIPAHWDNYGEEFPTNPSGVVWHWWNSVENRPSIASVINEFCNVSTSKSPHFIVTHDRVIQVVSLSDRAFHAGPGGNDKVGVEVDPLMNEKNADGSYTDRALKIQTNAKALAIELRDFYGRKLNNHLHKEFMATECSGFDLVRFNVADIVVEEPKVPDPVVVPVTPPPPIVVPLPDEGTVLRNFFDWLIKMFLERNAVK